MATIKDIANEAGVSVSTVSHVVNQTRFVSPAKTASVKAAIDKLGYTPSYLAKALKGNKTSTIGMLVTSSTNPFFAEVVSGVEEGSFEEGYSLILGNAGESSKRQIDYLNILVEKQIDGLIVMTTSRDRKFVNQLNKLSHLPKVVLDSEPISNGCAIGDDSFSGAKTAVEHLIKCGHSDIAFITGPTSHDRSDKRLMGAKSALEEAGLVLNDDFVREGSLDIPSGYKAAVDLLRTSKKPTAIFAFNDLMALGSYKALEKLNLSVPNDVSIIGYDNIEMSEYLTPGLTTVHQPGREIGRSTALMLIENLKHGKKLPSSFVFNPELVIRESVQSLHKED